MALITCKDCEKQVSPAAKACPNCGRPVAAQTIEQTGKRQKMLTLVSVAMIAVGFIYMFSLMGSGEKTAESSAMIFSCLISGGFILFIYARISAWWHHG